MYHICIIKVLCLHLYQTKRKIMNITNEQIKIIVDKFDYIEMINNHSGAKVCQIKDDAHTELIYVSTDEISFYLDLAFCAKFDGETNENGNMLLTSLDLSLNLLSEGEEIEIKYSESYLDALAGVILEDYNERRY